MQRIRSGATVARRWGRALLAPPARRREDPRPGEVARPAADADGGAEDFTSYWRDRLVQHTGDVYAGAPLQKFPEDLRAYEHLLWASRTNVVIELGSAAGGSTLWWRDRLETFHRYGRCGRPLVVAVDLLAEQTEAAVRSVDPRARHIRFLTGDVRSVKLPDQVGRLLRSVDRVTVIEDSAHDYDTTLAALRGFSRFVRPGGWFVVEDTVVDIDGLRVHATWPRGAGRAVGDWLESEQGLGFERDPGMEIYGMTCHPGGFLRRR